MSSRHPVSDRYRINEKPGTYTHYANLASAHERKKEWTDAAELWGRAKLRATKPENRAYASARKEVCEKNMPAKAKVGV